MIACCWPPRFSTALLGDRRMATSRAPDRRVLDAWSAGPQGVPRPAALRRGLHRGRGGTCAWPRSCGLPAGSGRLGRPVPSTPGWPWGALREAGRSCLSTPGICRGARAVAMLVSGRRRNGRARSCAGLAENRERKPVDGFAARFLLVLGGRPFCGPTRPQAPWIPCGATTRATGWGCSAARTDDVWLCPAGSLA
jgi:hypothetical protein